MIDVALWWPLLPRLFLRGEIVGGYLDLGEFLPSSFPGWPVVAISGAASDLDHNGVVGSSNLSGG